MPPVTQELYLLADTWPTSSFNAAAVLRFVYPRSAIHGRGLFCKRNIDAGEMVIEYSGIVIRSVLTDKREKYYDSKVLMGRESWREPTLWGSEI